MEDPDFEDVILAADESDAEEKDGTQVEDHPLALQSHAAWEPPPALLRALRSSAAQFRAVDDAGRIDSAAPIEAMIPAALMTLLPRLTAAAQRWGAEALLIEQQPVCPKPGPTAVSNVRTKVLQHALQTAALLVMDLPLGVHAVASTYKATDFGRLGWPPPCNPQTRRPWLKRAARAWMPQLLRASDPGLSRGMHSVWVPQLKPGTRGVGAQADRCDAVLQAYYFLRKRMRAKPGSAAARFNPLAGLARVRAVSIDPGTVQLGWAVVEVAFAESARDHEVLGGFHITVLESACVDCLGGPQLEPLLCAVPLPAVGKPTRYAQVGGGTAAERHAEEESEEEGVFAHKPKPKRRKPRVRGSTVVRAAVAASDAAVVQALMGGDLADRLRPVADAEPDDAVASGIGRKRRRRDHGAGTRTAGTVRNADKRAGVDP